MIRNRSARWFSLATSAILLVCAASARAETTVEVLDPNTPSRPTANTPTPVPSSTAPGPARRPGDEIPAVRIDKSGKVDEPDFKASVRPRKAPSPNFDPVSKGNNAIAIPNSPWAVPEEDGHVPATKPSGTADAKGAVTAEEISPQLAGIIAREKSGTKLADLTGELQAVVTADPQSAAARYRLGLALIRAGQPAKGLPEMERAIALQPRNPKYLCDYGVAALRAGWVEKSFAACQEAVNLVPTHGRYLSALGDVHLAAGHPVEASECYRRAIAGDPKNPAYFYNLGLACSRMKQLKSAIEAYTEAIALKKNEATFYCSRGLAYENLQNVKLALEDYQTAMKVDSKCAYAHYLYAGVFSDADDPTYTNQFEAVEHAEKAVKLTNYKNAQYIMGLARALRVARNYEQAADVAKKAVELEPARDDYRREWHTYERLKTNGIDK